MSVEPEPAAPGASLVAQVARFGRALRRQELAVTLSDQADALAALALVDIGDPDEVRRALRTALKIRPADLAAFLELFAAHWGARPAEEAGGPNANPPVTDPARAPRPREAPRTGRARPVPAALAAALAPPPAGGPEAELPEGDEPGYSAAERLRRRSFEECSAADLAAMERLMARFARRLATRRSRRRVPAPAGGEIDLRRSLRRIVRHGGELLTPARRARPVEKPRLVVLCDTSGSMDSHTRFLLAFVLAVRRVTRTEVFAFNTSLVRLTADLRVRAAGGTAAVLARLAAAVPGWSGGTRIGECLARFAERHLEELVDGRTVVVVLSDGLDRGDVAPLAGAMRAIRARARRVVWLNPLAGDRRYEPTARAMAAALPHIDRLLPAHNLESLERLLPLLAA